MTPVIDPTKQYGYMQAITFEESREQIRGVLQRYLDDCHFPKNYKIEWMEFIGDPLNKDPYQRQGYIGWKATPCN